MHDDVGDRYMTQLGACFQMATSTTIIGTSSKLAPADFYDPITGLPQATYDMRGKPRPSCCC